MLIKQLLLETSFLTPIGLLLVCTDSRYSLPTVEFSLSSSCGGDETHRPRKFGPNKGMYVYVRSVAHYDYYYSQGIVVMKNGYLGSQKKQNFFTVHTSTDKKETFHLLRIFYVNERRKNTAAVTSSSSSFFGGVGRSTPENFLSSHTHIFAHSQPRDDRGRPIQRVDDEPHSQEQFNPNPGDTQEEDRKINSVGT